MATIRTEMKLVYLLELDRYEARTLREAVAYWQEHYLKLPENAVEEEPRRLSSKIVANLDELMNRGEEGP